MSVMALSSQVGAPSNSFLSADKPIEPLKGAKPQSGLVYQGDNSQTVANHSASTASLHAPKSEVSGALEPSLSSFTAASNQTLPFTGTRPELLAGTKSSYASLSSSANNVAIQKAIVDLGVNASAQLHSNPSAPKLIDSTSQFSTNKSFSLLTGPRSIGGMRGGQIAASQTAVSVLSAPDMGLSALNGAVNPLVSLAPSTTAYSTESDIGSITSSNSDFANIFPTSDPITTSVAPLGQQKATSTAMSPFATEFSSGTRDSVVANVGDRTSPQANSLSEQFSHIFGQPAATKEPVGSESVAGELSHIQQNQAEQVRDEQAKQAREKAIQEQEQKQQALAEAFAKADNSQQAQQTQGEQTRQQDLAKEQVKQTQEKAIEQQKAQIDELKARDTEVKAHEHAHASVGGQYAQSPSFKYEKGADGQRYATDGEVQIDVSIVPGDPLATINKMKQVYAAAMAPVDPSSADIRVAAQALQKMNEAKAKLAEERQQQIVDQSTTETLIGAEAQLENLPQLKERQIQVTGKVDADGNITVPQDEPSAPVTEVIDKIKQAIAAQVASSDTSDAVNVIEVENSDTIEPPTATLAVGSVQSSQAENPQISSQRLESSARLFNKGALNLNQRDSNAVRFYDAVAVAALASNQNSTLVHNESSVDAHRGEIAEPIDDSALVSSSTVYGENSLISNGLTLDSSNRQDTRGLFNPQTLALHRPRFLDVNV
ncbi:putative metalloprotease CJM1_0395 family protein [Shewanella xiamenensis]|uniref:putative metalloprotease CJM1_0395 family protein n=1 Tax=Shewanella xiamenensis TaxID=332186 RepID=UPI0021504958|nr:putative metalloprotease CJM1_0395 family protein [Shewanella xiamenensis]MCR4535614.1 catalase [Shewanella xiamenensis]WHF57478.1 putative metalloprotease CJM1_0395 family protein [Shewanella xiamenensis]